MNDQMNKKEIDTTTQFGRHILIAAVLVIVLVMFITGVSMHRHWVNTFRYQYCTHQMGLVKIDRITGKAWILREGEYRRLEHLSDDEIWTSDE